MNSQRRKRVARRARAVEPERGDRERGSATVELAVGLPGLVLLLLFALGAVDAVIMRMECVDAARDGALAAARGEDGTAVARARAPVDAAVSVGRDGERVRAEVRVRVRPLGPHLPGIEVSGTAVTEAEPSSTEQSSTRPSSTRASSSGASNGGRLGGSG